MSTRRPCGLVGLPPPRRQARLGLAATLGATLICTLSGMGAAQTEKPLSAIDWLSRSVTRPVVIRRAVPPQAGAVPPRANGTVATGGVLPGEVEVSVLRQGPGLDAVGLLPATKARLPRDLWGKSRSDTLIRLILAERTDTLPALQNLFLRILLAEVDTPDDGGADGGLLLARVDRLLDLGALDQAQALLDLAGTDRPDLFRRWFDVALLLGEETRACTTMRARPDVAPTFPARIFCLARSGDWNAAALTLQTAEALGFVNAEQSSLLERFLDPGIEDGAAPLPPPSRPSPLVWRMMEAIGEPMPTNTLPLAFARADMRENIGWKSQIEAAERLARSGALSSRRLFALYTRRKPAASGGVWDRATRIQMLDAALKRNDAGAVARVLPAAWKAMAAVRLEVPFAALFGARLAKVPLTGQPAAVAFRAGLLSPDPAAIAHAHRPADAQEAFLAALAQGLPTGTVPQGALAQAVAAAFTDPPSVPADLAALADGGRMGEAILRAIDQVAAGATGDLRGLTGGLAALRRAGLEDTARQTALQLLLLNRQV